MKRGGKVTLRETLTTRSKVTIHPTPPHPYPTLNIFLENSRNTWEGPKCPVWGSGLPPTPFSPWAGPQEAVAGIQGWVFLSSAIYSWGN